MACLGKVREQVCGVRRAFCPQFGQACIVVRARLGVFGAEQRLGNNSTKIQPLGKRTIYYNPSTLDRFEEPKSKFDIVKEDKYLRCIKSVKPLPPLNENMEKNCKIREGIADV